MATSRVYRFHQNELYDRIEREARSGCDLDHSEAFKKWGSIGGFEGWVS